MMYIRVLVAFFIFSSVNCFGEFFIPGFIKWENSRKQTGAVYTRWGKTECPENSQKIYSGYAAGHHYNEHGSGSNFLCLPSDPEWGEFSGGADVNTGKISGVEYEINHDKPFSKTLNDKNAPCVVCQSSGRQSVLMIPAKMTCPRFWTVEYKGYLMSEGAFANRVATQYICVDEAPEGVSGGDGNTSQAVLYPVETECSTLRCPPYGGGKELTCIVCSQ